jgi:hypothetical protein
MLMEINTIAAETGAIEYLRDGFDAAGVPIKASRGRRTFDLPKSIWRTMLPAFGIFVLAITAATGHTPFMITLRDSYAAMYFGTAAATNAVGAYGRPAAVPREVDWLTGKLGCGTASAQILMVPLTVASFARCVVVFRAIAAR